MDGRTGFAAGGFLVGATAVAVACAVTLSNSAALADAPGTATGLDAVRVSPSGASVIPTPRASTPALVAPEISAPAPSAEVVPAPEPHEVYVAAVPPAVATPVPVEGSGAVDVASVSKDAIQDEALRTGSWDRLRAWAIAHGWPQARIENWIALLQAKMAVNKKSTFEANLTETPANAGIETGQSSSGSERTQSPQPPRGD